MKKSSLTGAEIFAFHVGRGGHFYNPGYVTYIGQHTIDEFIQDLYWDVDEETGDVDPDEELRDGSGNEVGITWEEVESGIGRIELDGSYDTVYTMRICNVDYDSTEWDLLTEDKHSEEALFLRPELGIETINEYAQYINENINWEIELNEEEACEINDWGLDENSKYLCHDYTYGIYLNYDKPNELHPYTAEVIEM